MNGQPHVRLNTFHGPKRQLLGNQAGHAAPAWRINVLPVSGVVGSGIGGRGATHELGSKIFLSRLPADVGEKEVEDLFRKTVGPLKESFLIYNSQGNSKGMAIVTFQRSEDAALARAKYNGKIVDGRRPLKIETIIDDVMPNVLSTKTQESSLLSRLSNKATVLGKTPNGNLKLLMPPGIPMQPRRDKWRPDGIRHRVIPSSAEVSVAPRRARHKRGPKRIKKQVPKSIAQLDKEIEDYRAGADVTSL